MKYVTISTFILWVVSSTIAVPQSIYIQKANGKVYEYYQDGRVYQKTEIVDVNGGYIEIVDIAIGPDNSLYALTQDGVICSVDWQSGIIQRLTQPYQIPSPALVCSGENRFIYLDLIGDLKEYNIQNGQTTTIASIAVTTPGDITLFKGNVVFPTHHEIMAYNLSSDSLYTMYCFDEYRNDFGIVSASTDCYNNVLLLPANKWDDGPHFFPIDVRRKKAVSFPQSNFAQGATNGFASEKEHLGLMCASEIVKPIDCLSTFNINQNKNLIQISPNPAHQFLTISGLKTPAQFNVFSINGQLIKKEVLTDGTVNISDLDAGTYILKLNDSGQVYSELLVVQ